MTDGLSCNYVGCHNSPAPNSALCLTHMVVRDSTPEPAETTTEGGNVELLRIVARLLTPPSGDSETPVHSDMLRTSKTVPYAVPLARELVRLATKIERLEDSIEAINRLRKVADEKAEATAEKLDTQQADMDSLGRWVREISNAQNPADPTGPADPTEPCRPAETTEKDATYEPMLTLQQVLQLMEMVKQ